QPDDGGLRDRGMGGEQILQLARADVLTLPDDDVLPPPGDAEIAGGVEPPEVAGAEPAVRGDGLGVERGGPVAEEALVAEREALALLSDRRGRVRLVHQPKLVRADRAPLAVDATFGRVVGAGGRDGRELRRAVDPLRDAAEARRRLAHERRI